MQEAGGHNYDGELHKPFNFVKAFIPLGENFIKEVSTSKGLNEGKELMIDQIKKMSPKQKTSTQNPKGKMAQQIGKLQRQDIYYSKKVTLLRNAFLQTYYRLLKENEMPSKIIYVNK